MTVKFGYGSPDKVRDVATILRPAEAAEAFEESMQLVRAMSDGGRPAPTKHYPIGDLEPAAVAAPLIWTGSNGPKSLAATGHQADGWIPGRAAPRTG